MSQTLTAHPQTGRPVVTPEPFEVGDLVTEHFLSDGYPGVVVHATPKTVWVSRVDYLVASQPGDRPGYDGYGDTATIVVDPESVEQALAAGKDGATKYVLYVPARATHGSLADQDQYGGTHHRAKYRKPGSPNSGLSRGARYRRDPHV